jgi:hypothetical protein
VQSAPLAIEHGTSRTGRWLRARRLKLALGLAVVEGVLVALGTIPVSVALLLAAAVIAAHVWVGRSLRSHALRQASWTLALSQAIVAFVPLLVLAVGVLAVIAVGAIALLALVVVLADRRR